MQNELQDNKAVVYFHKKALLKKFGRALNAPLNVFD